MQKLHSMYYLSDDFFRRDKYEHLEEYTNVVPGTIAQIPQDGNADGQPRQKRILSIASSEPTPPRKTVSTHKKHKAHSPAPSTTPTGRRPSRIPIRYKNYDLMSTGGHIASSHSHHAMTDNTLKITPIPVSKPSTSTPTPTVSKPSAPSAPASAPLKVSTIKFLPTITPTVIMPSPAKPEISKKPKSAKHTGASYKITVTPSKPAPILVTETGTFSMVGRLIDM